ncbi:hypothetical protein CLV41_1011257 [Roseibium marinum]|uniref:Uncharacterized protein n=1 Tax=Roseibium marinum TaxID=281252 RepID=A0A2S3V483_9HYPH|nr:hypothetical protein CLV41_1011257 [Roseibium marinum]
MLKTALICREPAFLERSLQALCKLLVATIYGKISA